MFKTKLSRAFLVGVVALVILGGLAVFNLAYGEDLPEAPQVPIQSVGDILKIFCDTAFWFLSLVFLVATLAILWAAFKYITAGGEDKNITAAKQILTYAIIGIVIALVAFSVIDVVYTVLAPGGNAGNIFNGICPDSGNDGSDGGDGDGNNKQLSPHGGSCQVGSDCVQGNDPGCADESAAGCNHVCEGNTCVGGITDGCVPNDPVLGSCSQEQGLICREFGSSGEYRCQVPLGGAQ